jgi:hypothetical protein
MTKPSCPECGHETAADATACEKCGHAMNNGAVPQVRGPVLKPPPPPELVAEVFEKTPPELIDEFRRTFNEEEFLAELRQAEQAGLPELKDLIRDLEQETASRD